MVLLTKRKQQPIIRVSNQPLRTEESIPSGLLVLPAFVKVTCRNRSPTRNIYARQCINKCYQC
ncbi:hypothetical protein PSPTOT1_1436 [Pseudomonas syringae pv. tomato T1]|nr:hypothetical protein PSPTOT1_1436 [Pseudomonas syringae pv. tomato T1]